MEAPTEQQVIQQAMVVSQLTGLLMSATPTAIEGVTDAVLMKIANKDGSTNANASKVLTLKQVQDLQIAVTKQSATIASALGILTPTV